jgi:hypothetical protein
MASSTKKLSEFGIKVPKNTENIVSESYSGLSSFSKWVPLICAGAAVGVSVLALKEIKNVRKELMNLKKDSSENKGVDPQLVDKIELMDEQLRKITQYLANQNKPSPIIKNAVKEDVKIVNEQEEEVEYEELEVTDDES